MSDFRDDFNDQVFVVGERVVSTYLTGRMFVFTVAAVGEISENDVESVKKYHPEIKVGDKTVQLAFEGGDTRWFIPRFHQIISIDRDLPKAAI